MQYQTINKTAAMTTCPVSAGTLRAMVKRGEIPGFYNGTRFYVDTEALPHVLRRRSMATVSTGDDPATREA